MPTIRNGDADQLARQVLRKRLKVRPGESVTIEAYSSSIPWALGFVRECRRLGAKPLLHYEDEDAYWTAVTEGQSAILGHPGDNEWGALGETDAYVYFWGPEDLARRAKLSSAEDEATTSFNGDWYKRAHKAGLRGVRMAIARVTEANARHFGVRFGPWQKTVYAASLRDPETLRKDATKVARALERGHEVELRHANGTKLSLALKGRPAQVTIGDISPAARKSAFGMMANVPDGTVYAAVDEETAEGTIVANRSTVVPGAAPLRGGHLAFRDGKLLRYGFSAGGAGFARDYRAAGKGRDKPSFLEIGLDPSVEGAPMLEECERGAITVGVGRNAGFGGATSVNFLGYVTTAGAELRIDGHPIVRSGRVVS